jgi:hypothetical protein
MREADRRSRLTPYHPHRDCHSTAGQDLAGGADRVSPMSPMMTGPTPKISVTVVWLALTAAASFFVCRSWVSRLCRSSRNWRNAARGCVYRERRVRPDCRVS